MRTPKENKRNPRNRTLKSAAGTIPKAALKAAWIKTKEQTRTVARENDTDPRQPEPTDLAGSVAEQAAAFVWRQGRKLAETQARQQRQKEAAARVHAAGERGVSPKQTEYGTLPDAAQRPRRGADLPRQRAKEKAVTAKTAPRDIRGVTQSQRQLRTAANETVRSITTQAQMQTRTRQVQLAIQKAASSTCKTAVAVRSAVRHFLVGLHSLVAAIAAGISVALSIIIVISLVAFVSGSAYGIFFAANAPNENAVTVQEAVETLTAEYRNRLEEISDTVQHDRQDITANDDVYYIRWQDVLAVFSSYVAGSEQGAPVAALTKNQVDKLREIMWAMNAVDYSTRAETAVIETTDKNGKVTTTEITETVLVISLTHKTPDEMAADYHFTTRQNTYLQLLQDPQYEELWAELLCGFEQGGGEVMSPDGTRAPTGTLQWPLPLRVRLPRSLVTAWTPSPARSAPTPAPTLPAPRERRFLLRQTAPLLLPTVLTAGAVVTATTFKSTTAAGWKRCMPTVRPSASPPVSRCSRERLSDMLGIPGRATGNHLHLEVSVDGNRADVLRYFTL